MPSFRKKPVVIEAIQFEGENYAEVYTWAELLDGNENQPLHWSADDGLHVQTLEGDMRADAGDWIIRGVKGELYPCKPDIFAETYEPA